jgi:hypothetical protein
MKNIFSIFFRIFEVVVIIQAFIENDKPIAVTLLWFLGMLNSIFNEKK